MNKLQKEILGCFLKGITTQTEMSKCIGMSRKFIGGACLELAKAGFISMPARGRRSALIVDVDTVRNIVDGVVEQTTTQFPEFREYKHISRSEMERSIVSFIRANTNGHKAYFSKYNFGNVYGLARWEVDHIVDQLVKDGWLKSVQNTFDPNKVSYIVTDMAMGYIAHLEKCNRMSEFARRANEERRAQIRQRQEQQEAYNRQLVVLWKKDAQQHPELYGERKVGETCFIVPRGVKILRDPDGDKTESGHPIFRVVVDKQSTTN